MVHAYYIVVYNPVYKGKGIYYGNKKDTKNKAYDES